MLAGVRILCVPRGTHHTLLRDACLDIVLTGALYKTSQTPPSSSLCVRLSVCPCVCMCALPPLEYLQQF